MEKDVQLKIYEIAIIEVEKNMGDQVRTMELMRDTSKILIGASGFFLGLMGVMGFTNKPAELTFWLIIPFAFYLCSLVISLLNVLGSAWFVPFSLSSFDDLLNGIRGEKLDNETYEDLFNQKLSNYLEARNLNVDVVNRRIELTKWAIAFFLLALISVPIVGVMH